MDKKGSMELGINAIVVLIIALALLGLAIGFISKLIGGSQDKFQGLIDNSVLPVHASADKPFVFDPPSVRVKANKKFELTVVVYNSLTTNADVELSMLDDTCKNEEGEDVTSDANGVPYLRIISAIQTLKSGQEGGFKAVIRAGDLNPGTYICTVVADLAGKEGNPPPTESFSQQIFIEVYR
jgi:hypothetical protein